MSHRFSLAVALREETESTIPDLEQKLQWPVRIEPAQKFKWFLGRCVERVESLGLTLSVEHDFEEMQSLLERTEGYDEFINPAYDPRWSDLNRTRSFWIRVDDREGRMVSCIAAKMFRYVSLYPHLANLSIWYDAVDDLPMPNEKIEMIADFPKRMGGTISMTGRLWTHPRWRNRGLSSWLPLMARTMMLTKHDVDWHFGLVGKELVDKKVPLLRYGFPRNERVMNVKPAGTDKHFELYMVYMSREELIADVDAAVVSG